MFSKVRKKQAGQSLIYVGLLVVVIISGVFFVYDIGNIVNTKIKFQSGADSAALASVAVKISKHHTDTLVRAAMYNESIAAQSQQRAAQAKLVSIITTLQSKIDANPVVNPVNPPINPINVMTDPVPPVGPPQPPPLMPDEQDKGNAAQYRELVNSTYRHVVKLHRETRALQAYYDWLSGVPSDPSKKGVGREAVTEASRIGFRGNTLGLLNIPENIEVLSDPEQMLENKQANGNQIISGVTYFAEGSSKIGNFGKTYIEVEPANKRSSQGVSLLKYADKYILRTNAAAKIASSDDLKLQKSKLSFLPLGSLTTPVDLHFLWYSPRLMAITKNGKGEPTVH